MTTSDTAQTWLTQDAHDRLSNELARLIADRPAIAAEINARREEGDLKENGGYHAARDEQGKQEARIRHLEALLRDAKVGAASTPAGEAGAGSVVTVRYDGDEDTETFLIGSREEAGTTDIDVYSAQSPLGKALIGSKSGASVAYEAPNGKTIRLTLVDAKPFSG